MIRKIYDKLQDWIVMLSGDLEETDAGIVRTEMMELCSKIWSDKETHKQSHQKPGSSSMDGELGIGSSINESIDDTPRGKRRMVEDDVIARNDLEDKK